MSRLQGKPYAQKVVESLDATERANLLGLLNGSSVVPTFRSLTNASAYITSADDGVSHISLETADGNLTGYLAYTDDYVTLFAYERNSQGIAQYELDLDAMTIKTIGETLDIEGLRTIVTDSLKADLVGGKVPAEQLPSYVDDVVEYEDLAHFPAEGEAGKIYIALDTGSTYRWGGTEYVQIGGSSATPMVSITWSELKALRDAGELLPGQQYRITDYTFTTTDTDTSSAGHVFDIIVTAEDESHLEEEAFATHHAGDTYFANNKLEAWRLWYSLDNDTNRFAWADSTNGKGVVYRMIDEFNNDIPYDFKNCLAYGSYTFTRKVDGNNADASLTLYGDNQVYDNVIGKYIYNGKQSLNKNRFVISSGNLKAYKNVFGDNCRSNGFGNSCYENTFGSECRGNSFGDGCYSNAFGIECYNNTFGNTCYRNTFGNICYGNTFQTSCQYNTFESDCYSNTLGSSCTNNTFGTGCNNNSFGGGCSRNHFGTACYSNSLNSSCSDIELGEGSNNNTFGSYCQYIAFGINCDTNNFGNGCTNNSFGVGSSNNTFGNGCVHNTFGNNCGNNSLGSDCSYNSLGNGCGRIKISRNCSDIILENRCLSINIGPYTSTNYYARNIVFDPGIAYVTLTSADDANASSSNQLQNIHIHSGIAGDSNTPLSIVVPERGQSYSYDYYATNSVDVMI